MKIAGSRRKRKNAVDLQVPDYEDRFHSGRGRPSKGGQAVRSHRYYAKNHLLVLQKRRLKRYTTRVKAHLEENDYKSNEILTKLQDTAKTIIKHRIKLKIEMNDLLTYINLARDDRYLPFLNEEGQAYIQSLFEDQPDKYPSSEQLAVVSTHLRNNHTIALFKLCTLLSAYLLARYVEKLHADIEDPSILDQKLRQGCHDLYVIDYTHLQNAASDDEENEHYEEAPEQQQEEQVEESIH